MKIKLYRFFKEEIQHGPYIGKHAFEDFRIFNHIYGPYADFGYYNDCITWWKGLYFFFTESGIRKITEDKESSECATNLVCECDFEIAEFEYDKKDVVIGISGNQAVAELSDGYRVVTAEFF